MIERTCAILRTSFPFRLRSPSFHILSLSLSLSYVYREKCRQGGPPESHHLSLTHDFFLAADQLSIILRIHGKEDEEEKIKLQAELNCLLLLLLLTPLIYIFPPSSSVVDWK
jgi:hypothetical protein